MSSSPATDAPPKTRRRLTLLLVLFLCGLGVGGVLVARLGKPGQVSAGPSASARESSTGGARQVAPPTVWPLRADAQPTVTSAAPAGQPASPAWAYDIRSVTPTAGFGVERLHIVHARGSMQQTPVAPADLRLPNDHLHALTDQNRFGDLRGPGHFMHLGSDYASQDNVVMVPPTDDAVLVAEALVEPYTYVGVAIDMSGSIQMHAVTVQTERGAALYLICYAHLSPASNDQAMAQALASAGHVTTIGTVASLEPGGGVLSDFHIAVIEVARLYRMTGEDDLEAALLALFTREMPRDNQKYAEIFVRPEDVMTALEPLLPDA